MVVALYYYEDLTMREVGEMLDVTESRASQIHMKALLRLKLRLNVSLGPDSGASSGASAGDAAPEPVLETTLTPRRPRGDR